MHNPQLSFTQQPNPSMNRSITECYPKATQGRDSKIRHIPPHTHGTCHGLINCIFPERSWSLNSEPTKGLIKDYLQSLLRFQLAQTNLSLRHSEVSWFCPKLQGLGELWFHLHIIEVIWPLSAHVHLLLWSAGMQQNVDYGLEDQVQTAIEAWPSRLTLICFTLVNDIFSGCIIY